VKQSSRLPKGEPSYQARLLVRPPFRLDLTVDALRRIRTNVVDVTTRDGRYLRAFTDGPHVSIIEVQQHSDTELDVRILGRNGARTLETVKNMLGTDIDLRGWYRRAKRRPWIEELAVRFRGVKPPRYPDLWEALCHSIVFQQLSIPAAAATMQRMVEHFSTPVEYLGTRLYPFPRPELLLGASTRELHEVGLSRMKSSYILAAADAVSRGVVSARRIELLSTKDATAELCMMKGIGPWSAAVVLLRGFARLDTFPLRDSGAARSTALLSGSRAVKIEAVLSDLGPVRGMLYFHLLLGTAHNSKQR
jgi:DNA-3-methyladenine glycosylase II